MRRRDILKSAVAAGIVGGTGVAAPAVETKQNFLNLHWFRSRNDLDTQRLRDYLGNSAVPALNRAGAKPVGLFQTSIGPDSPSILLVTQYPSLAAVDETYNRLQADKKWKDEFEAFDAKPDLAYERRENWLLRAFSSFPAIEVPKVEPGKQNLFELRMYESRNSSGHTRKVSMFNNGEIDVFRRCGIVPVFFGSMMFGPKMPNLVYMTCHPGWQARDEAWAKFRVDPDWKKMSTAPGMENRELVSTISVQLMTPLAASQIL
jgi:hypothetical protein